MADGAISDVKLGSGERAIGPSIAGGTRTVSHAPSPDGKRIVYEMEPDSKPDAHFIAMADAADGRNFHKLTTEGSSIRPTWSVDGRHVAFLGQRAVNKDSWHVYRIDTADGVEKQISQEPVAPTVRPSFAADGRLVYAIDRGREGKLPFMDLVISDGAQETKLITKNWVLASATSPDGMRLAAIVPGELSVRDLKTGQVQTFPMKDVNPNWRVTYCRLSGGRTTERWLWILSFSAVCEREPDLKGTITWPCCRSKARSRQSRPIASATGNPCMDGSSTPTCSGESDAARRS
jgi:dipeptidyl aminopeptidase/acylaminoacyl peptidase